MIVQAGKASSISLDCAFIAAVKRISGDHAEPGRRCDDCAIGSWVRPLSGLQC